MTVAEWKNHQSLPCRRGRYPYGPARGRPSLRHTRWPIAPRKTVILIEMSAFRAEFPIANYFAGANSLELAAPGISRA